MSISRRLPDDLLFQFFITQTCKNSILHLSSSSSFFFSGDVLFADGAGWLQLLTRCSVGLSVRNGVLCVPNPRHKWQALQLLARGGTHYICGKLTTSEHLGSRGQIGFIYALVEFPLGRDAPPSGRRKLPCASAMCCDLRIR